MQPPASSFPPHPGSFGAVVSQATAPPGPRVVIEGSSSLAGNYSFSGKVQPNQTDLSHRTNVRTDDTGSMNSAQTFMQSGSQSAHPHPSPNKPMWMPSAPTFQVPTGISKTPLIPSSVPSPSTSTILSSSADSSAHIRTFMPPAPVSVIYNPPIQHNFPSPSPQEASPGLWLQNNGLARPPFSPYAPLCAPYSMPSCGMPPVSVSYPDIQPPGVGVSPPISAVGVPAADGQSVGSGQAELLSGIDTKEQLDAWTAHRTETGTVYYYNAVTGKSTYEKPPGFKVESNRATLQTTPVSWEKLTGTDWTLVTTNDGKKYYYNSTTQLSSWQIPSDVIELKKQQDADALKAQSVLVPSVVMNKGVDLASLSTPAANTGGRDATSIRPAAASTSSSALDLIKKKLQDSGIPDSTSQSTALSSTVPLELNGSKPTDGPSKDPQMEKNKDKRKDTNGDVDTSNSSSDSEDEDGGPTREECILQFKEMLKERGVAPFSKWEKELPKIVFDPRFKAVPNHDARRAIFEHYVRTRAEEERKEKRAAQKAAVEGFKQLLEEAKEEIDHKTDFQTFKRRWGDDPRFLALDKKDRETLLNERVLPLKRSAQERAQAERAAIVSNFKSMLQDRKDITSSSRWSKVKDSLKSDPRYKSVKHDDREKLFDEYVAELKAAEEETMRKAKAKQDEEEKLRERERSLRKRKEREEQEVERVRRKAHRKEAIESYQALLVETIKDPQASWTESKPKLEKDPQGRAANPHLDKSDLEMLFREHVKTLYERCMVEFKGLLADVITEAAAQETEGKTVITSWSTAKQVLKNDPRYNKMPRKERESLWRRHAEDILRKLKKSSQVEVDGRRTHAR
ncbi:pre-mRNA-processing protein PRP40 [Striga asiatica]|uniref:Pre-mRNA-processing protein PRP40 n=1 Tax=Striga asiatica TaxID=4170 RepID=A0A5A7Q9U0_STRAF|nr:pre-mRNA-processing protein PRP40 [Striga asiatica]